MAEQEDNKDFIARRLVTVAALLTDLIGKDVMAQPDSGLQQDEPEDAEPNETRREGPRCR